jgi:hypothetical protein
MTEKQKIIKVVGEILNIHEDPISDENAIIEFSMGELKIQ